MPLLLLPLLPLLLALLPLLPLLPLLVCVSLTEASTREPTTTTRVWAALRWRLGVGLGLALGRRLPHSVPVQEGAEALVRLHARGVIDADHAVCRLELNAILLPQRKVLSRLDHKAGTRLVIGLRLGLGVR